MSDSGLKLSCSFFRGLEKDVSRGSHPVNCAIATISLLGKSWHIRGPMTKPQEYREQRIIRCETHYQVQEAFPKGPQAGSGVLTTGRVVWVRDDAGTGNAAMTAFAEGIGVVFVDPQSV